MPRTFTPTSVDCVQRVYTGSSGVQGTHSPLQNTATPSTLSGRGADPDQPQPRHTSADAGNRSLSQPGESSARYDPGPLASVLGKALPLYVPQEPLPSELIGEFQMTQRLHSGVNNVLQSAIHA